MKIHQRENHQKLLKENEIQNEDIQVMSISDSDSQIINIADENQSKNKKIRKNIKCDRCSTVFDSLDKKLNHDSNR